MFNGLFQPTHLILILVVVLIVFGPGKLPEVGKAMGKTLRDMRNAFASSDEDEKKEQSSVKGPEVDHVAAATTATVATTAAGTARNNTAN